MPNREKVIKGLECCIPLVEGIRCPKECPYLQDGCGGVDRVMADALILLKEQEPMEPVCTEYDRAIVLFSCRDCKTQLLYGQRYCHMCGRKVRWSD